MQNHAMKRVHCYDAKKIGQTLTRNIKFLCTTRFVKLLQTIAKNVNRRKNMSQGGTIVDEGIWPVHTDESVCATLSIDGHILYPPAVIRWFVVFVNFSREHSHHPTGSLRGCSNEIYIYVIMCGRRKPLVV